MNAPNITYMEIIKEARKRVRSTVSPLDIRRHGYRSHFAVQLKIVWDSVRALEMAKRAPAPSYGSETLIGAAAERRSMETKDRLSITEIRTLGNQK